jgi:hypothetical protein
MLAPNLLDAQDDLAAAADILRQVGAFVDSCQSAAVGRLDPQPPWLDNVTATLVRCREVATDWYNSQQAIVTPITTAYITYASTMAGVTTAMNPMPSDADAWMPLLDELQAILEANTRAVIAAQLEMDRLQQGLRGAHSALRDALAQAWQAHEGAHAALQNIAAAIGVLYGRLGELGARATAPDLAAGRTLVETTAKITFAIAMEGAGAAIPFVGIGLAVLSVGQSAYALVAGDNQIQQTLDTLYTLLNQQSQEVRALAATGAVLALLDAMDQGYTSAAQHLPRLNSLWDTEAAKIGMVRQAMRANVRPGDMTELASLPTALTVWHQLASVASGIATQQVERGPTVELTPRPLSAAKVS